MSRHGYIEFEGEDPLAEGRWRGAMQAAKRGKRGQAFFRDLIEALDEMPVKELAAHSFTRDGEVCSLGALALKRVIDVSEFEPPQGEDEWDDEIDHDALATKFGIAACLAREVMYENDECDQWHWEDTGAVTNGVRYGETRPYRTHDTPAERWQRMRAWAVRNLRPAASGGTDHGT
jgi:hypothetical protein